MIVWGLPSLMGLVPWATHGPKGSEFLDVHFHSILALTAVYCYAVSIAYHLSRTTRLGHASVLALPHAFIATVANLVLGSVLFFCGCLGTLESVYKK